MKTARRNHISPEIIATARRLREEEGKTFKEISDILKVKSSTIRNIATKDNWKSGNSEKRKEEAKVATATIKKIKEENKHLNEDAEVLLAKLKDIGIENVLTFGKLALEPLMLRSIRIALTSNCHKTISETVKDIIKLMESEAFALKETERKLTIMVPQIREIYEDPPEDSEEFPYEEQIENDERADQHESN